MEPHEASNLDDGIERAREIQPEVLLLDVRFEGPWRTGIDAIGDFRQVAPSCQIIVMTALPNAYDEALATAAGAVAYVAKDVASVSLLTLAARGSSSTSIRARRSIQAVSPLPSRRDVG